MIGDSSPESEVVEQRRDHCAALLTEIVTECPFRGERVLKLVSLEDETRAFPESTEIGLAALAWFVALLLFGWQVNLRDERARQHAWQAVVRPAVRGYLARKGFSDAEFMVLVRRLLAEESPLRKMLLQRPGGGRVSGVAG